MAHESEIPNPSDYVLRYIVDDPLIVVRDWEKQVRALLNACRHRGMQVCRSEMGNASDFRCPYHGWTYRNDGALIFIVDMRREYLYRLGARRTIRRSAVKLAGQGADSEKTTGPEGKKLGRGFERALV